MDLDLDFDLDDDKIKSFLESKLNEIKAKNEQLEQTLRDRQQFSKNLIENSNMQMEESDVEISAEVWKIFNGKYVIGATVVNKSSRSLCDLNVILDWDSTYPLSYQLRVHQKNNFSSKNIQPSTFCNEKNCTAITNSLKDSNKIDQSAYLIITFDLPQFRDKISYTLTGNVTFQQDNIEKYLAFPPIELSSLDATNHQLINFPLTEDGIKDILTIISASVRTDLVMMLQRGWGNSTDSTFEILCSLLKIEVQSKCTKFFIARRLSPVFDDSLIEVHALSSREDLDSFSLVMYTRNQDCVFPLLHHLYSNIPGVLIIPKKLHENYLLQHCDVIASEEERNLENFSECVNGEIKHVKKFLQEYERVPNEDTDVVKFRSHLADLEKATDLYYLRLCKIRENV